VRFDGVSQLPLAPHKRDVSMVFQHFALYPHLTALDNLVVALRYGRKLPKKEATDRARETLQLVGLTELAKRKPGQMSGGQRQRVAIGRALATRAAVVLLDEPMSGLDAVLRVSLRIDIVALLRRLGSTAVFVTHDQSEAMVIGDRVAVMNNGRFEQVGTPDEIYDRPESRFVASFVGSPPMNLLNGAREGDRGELRGPGFTVAAPPTAATVGVRPEHLRVANGVDGGGKHAKADPETIGPFVIRGEVVATERLGAERIAFVTTEGGVVAVRLDASRSPAPKEAVTLSAPRPTLSFFDGAGRRLDPVAVP
jgi:multiple sugar transport system ATP-binding protein